MSEALPVVGDQVNVRDMRDGQLAITDATVTRISGDMVYVKNEIFRGVGVPMVCVEVISNDN